MQLNVLLLSLWLYEQGFTLEKVLKMDDEEIFDPEDYNEASVNDIENNVVNLAEELSSDTEGDLEEETGGTAVENNNEQSTSIRISFIMKFIHCYMAVNPSAK